MPVKEWDNERERRLFPPLEAFKKNANESAKASAALEAVTQCGTQAEFRSTALRATPLASHDPQLLSQLAWCYGHFGEFGRAVDHYDQALALRDFEPWRRSRDAYAGLPQSGAPKAPNLFLQKAPFFVLPLLSLIACLAFVLHAINRRVPEVYLVNGTDFSYEVALDGEVISLPPRQWIQHPLKAGPVDLVPNGETFDRYQFDVIPASGKARNTYVINPDKTAIISWEEIAYRPSDEPADENGTDQLVYHVGDPVYVFNGVTDHFNPPPDRLELHSKSAETYRVAVQFVDQSPVESVSLLLGQGEVDLATSYLKNVLSIQPGNSRLLTLLAELSPNEETLTFLEPALSARPIRLEWHRVYQTLVRSVRPDVDLTEEYQERLKVDPENLNLHYLHAATLPDASAEAMETYRLVADAKVAATPLALQRLGRDALRQGQFASAKRWLDRAIAIRPDHPYLRELEEEIQIATNDYSSLIERYAAILAAHPLDQAVAMTLAGLYEVSGQEAKAKEVTETFIAAATQSDSNLDQRAQRGIRLFFQGVRAQWAGDHEGLIKAAELLGHGDWMMNVHLLKGRYAEAAALIETENDDPIVHLLFYTLITLRSEQSATAEAHLTKALALMENQPGFQGVPVTWFRADARPPSLEDTLMLGLDNAGRRVFLAALGCRHPSMRDVCFALARKLNYTRVFPYLALKQALE